MVKVSYEDFVSKVDKLFTESKDKHSLYFTFKRLYKEEFKYKRNRKIRKQRLTNQLEQENDKNREYNILCRVKLNKQRCQTVVEPKDLSKFQNILMKIFSLHFITEKAEVKPKVKTGTINKKSKTLRRKEKKLKKLSLKVKKSEAEKAPEVKSN